MSRFRCLRCCRQYSLTLARLSGFCRSTRWESQHTTTPAKAVQGSVEFSEREQGRQLYALVRPGDHVRRFVVDEEERALVEMIHELRQQGMAIEQIVLWLMRQTEYVSKRRLDNYKAARVGCRCQGTWVPQAERWEADGEGVADGAESLGSPA